MLFPAVSRAMILQRNSRRRSTKSNNQPRRLPAVAGLMFTDCRGIYLPCLKSELVAGQELSFLLGEPKQVSLCIE